MIEYYPLWNWDKKFANHSAIRTLVKKLRQSYILKSEIIGIITGHNSEAGLDGYDSRN